MSGVLQIEERLERLRALRDRIAAEIATDERILAEAERRRHERDQAAARAARRAERAAEEAQLLALAPAPEVRAWAASHGISTGVHGRLSREVRLAYIRHLTGESTTP